MSRHKTVTAVSLAHALDGEQTTGTRTTDERHLPNDQNPPTGGTDQRGEDHRDANVGPPDRGKANLTTNVVSGLSRSIVQHGSARRLNQTIDRHAVSTEADLQYHQPRTSAEHSRSDLGSFE